MSIVSESKTGSREQRETEDSVARKGVRRRQQALAAMNEDTVTSLDQIFEAKLNAVRAYEQRLSRVADPYARQTLQKMIQAERRQLLNLAELIDLVEESPNMGGFTKATRQMKHRLNAGNGKNALYGFGAIVLAALLIPGVKDAFKPLLGKVMSGVNELSEQAQGLVSSVKEDMEDLVAEAEFEKLKQAIDDEVSGEELSP